MNPVTHTLSSWLVAQGSGTGPEHRRDRAIVTLAGVLPDFDGLGIIVEALTKGTRYELLWFSDYHRVFGHNIGFGLAMTAAAFAAANRRVRSALLVFACFHLHLFCDLVGGRGPDGHQWPIPYLLPFSRAWQFVWSGQWALNAWPNFVITAAVLAATLYLAWRQGFSPLEIVSRRADAGFVAAIRRRFPRGERDGDKPRDGEPHGGGVDGNGPAAE